MASGVNITSHRRPLGPRLEYLGDPRVGKPRVVTCLGKPLDLGLVDLDLGLDGRSRIDRPRSA